MSLDSAFPTEASLVDAFVSTLQNGDTAFGDGVQVTKEWDHRSGYVDVLVRDGTNCLIAFEAKLRDWKRAVDQAYRNTAYANKAYIVLPEKAAAKAIKHREQFVRRGIGLCAVRQDGVSVLIEAVEQDVLLAWLRAKAHEFFDGNGDELAGEAI